MGFLQAVPAEHLQNFEHEIANFRQPQVFLLKQTLHVQGLGKSSGLQTDCIKFGIHLELPVNL